MLPFFSLLPGLIEPAISHAFLKGKVEGYAIKKHK